MDLLSLAIGFVTGSATGAGAPPGGQDHEHTAEAPDFDACRGSPSGTESSEGAEEDQTASKEAKEGAKTSFMDQIEMPKEITITAWYTPEIPVNQGPEGYWGLPGLILEVNDGKTTILCSKVVLNPKEKADIKAPAAGKEVSQKEYDEIVIKKMEEMSEMGGRGGFQMRMNR